MDLIQVYVKYDLYETLELEIDASTNDIKKKYKKLAIKFHPDKYLSSDELSEDEKKTLQNHFNLVNIAYDILSNDETRTAYDKARKEYLDAGQFMDLKKQFGNFEFSYGDANEGGAKKVFLNENDKMNTDNEKLAEEIRENTKRNLNKPIDIQKINNFNELLNSSGNQKAKGEYLDKFNNLFDSFRQKSNKNTEIMAYDEADTIPTLDNAFNLMDVSSSDYVDPGMTLEQRMSAYQADYNALNASTTRPKAPPVFTEKIEEKKRK